MEEPMIVDTECDIRGRHGFLLFEMYKSGEGTERGVGALWFSTKHPAWCDLVLKQDLSFVCRCSAQQALDA